MKPLRQDSLVSAAVSVDSGVSQGGPGRCLLRPQLTQAALKQTATRQSCLAHALRGLQVPLRPAEPLLACAKAAWHFEQLFQKIVPKVLLEEVPGEKKTTGSRAAGREARTPRLVGACERQARG
jgi:hypothetical protein